MSLDLQVQSLVQMTAEVEAMEAVAQDHWLALEYPKRLWGGWMHPDGRRIDTPAKAAMKFHAACQALFCPFCLRCGKPERPEQGAACLCDEPAHCWQPIGMAPKDEDYRPRCPRHGEVPWRRAMTYSTICNAAGNQSGKTYSAASEFAAWIIGRREWDDTLTAEMRPNGLWLINVKDLSKDIVSVIGPELELRLKRLNPLITKSGNSGAPNGMLLRETGDYIMFFSNTQVRNSGENGVLPIEGPRFRGMWVDEPMMQRARSAAQRGLVAERSRGGGREIISATIIHDAYTFYEIYEKAGNKGGEKKNVYSMESTIYDNPSLTKTAIAQIVQEWMPEERDARTKGTFSKLSGRIYGMWDETVHVFDDARWSPLLRHDRQHVREDQAEAEDCSDWPIICMADPHSRRPWAIVWATISPAGEWHIIKCWPEEPYEKLRRSNFGFDDYAHVFETVERNLPGGAARVLYRVMDVRGGSAPVGGLTVTEEMATRGYWFESADAGRIEDGEEAVKTLLRFKRPITQLTKPLLFVAASCRNVWWSFNNYAYKDDGSDDARLAKAVRSDRGKDHMDCIRYGVLSQPSYAPWQDVGRRNKRAMKADRKGMINMGMGS